MRKPDRRTPRRGLKPEGVDGLEPRRLLSTVSQAASSQVTLVRHEYDGFVGVLKAIELKSQATPAEYLALRDDARAISQDASPSAPMANQKAVAVSLQLDLAPLEGWLSDSGWATVRQNLTNNLEALGIGEPLIDTTFADMKALAASAGVTADEFASYTSDFNRLRAGEAGLQGGLVHYADPSVYYTQHLRGFFPGGIADKRAAQAVLSDDIASAATGPSGAAAVRTEANLLESIGAGIPSQEDAEIGADFASAFASGSPGPAALDTLGDQVEATLGSPGATPSGPVARLISGAPAFYRGVGSSQANVLRIVQDVRLAVDSGGDSRLNPFVVQIA